MTRDRRASFGPKIGHGTIPKSQVILCEADDPVAHTMNIRLTRAYARHGGGVQRECGEQAERAHRYFIGGLAARIKTQITASRHPAS